MFLTNDEIRFFNGANQILGKYQCKSEINMKTCCWLWYILHFTIVV